ncbi:MAG: hypothetical protein R2775_05065 [Flavobacteriaceae bacterium]
MIKKRIFYALILSVFLLLGFIYLNKVFASSHRYANTIEDFDELTKKENIDIIFYGSSHSFTCYNPLIINNITKTTSYNLGSDALLMSLTDLVLEQSLKKTKPKLIILEVYKGTITAPSDTKEAKGYQLRALDLVSNFSFKKYTEVERIYNKNEYLGVLFPLIRNHTDWNSKNFSSFSKRVNFDPNDFYYGGYVGYGTIIGEKDNRSKYENFRNQEKRKNNKDTLLNNKIKEDIAAFLKIANEQNIPVLAVTSPDLRAIYENYYLYDEFRIFFDKFNVPYLNLNDYYDELDLSVNDFRDPGHLNRTGGTKASKFLANYLNEHYKFDDRSSESTWQSINKKYLDFKNTYEERIYQKQLQANLIESIKVKDIELTNSGQIYSIKITIDGTKNYKDDYGKYSLSLKIFPYDNNELSDYSKSKNWNFDKEDIKLKDEDSILTFQLKSKIKEIKQIEMFLYNTEEYKGVIGEKLIINNLDLLE